METNTSLSEPVPGDLSELEEEIANAVRKLKKHCLHEYFIISARGAADMFCEGWRQAALPKP